MRTYLSYFLLSTLFLVVALIASQLIFSVNPLAIGEYFLAQIGITASVSPNPANTLAQQLQKKESQLQEKERDLVQQELILQERARQDTQSEKRNFFYLSIVGGILLILVLLNFYRDYKHESKLSKFHFDS